MTAGKRTPRTRRYAKPVVGIVVLLAQFISPFASTFAPDEIDGLFDHPSAYAQSIGITQGDPDSCPSDLSDLRLGWGVSATDSSLCVLETVPCPPLPWSQYEFLTPSTAYPEFCEFITGPGTYDYADCTLATGALVTIDTAGDCTYMTFSRCPFGVQVSDDTCRLVERRTWSCIAGTVPRNEFNTCAPLLPVGSVTDHPACGAGAPAFAVSSCDVYVGFDVIADPSSVACSSFDPTAAPLLFRVILTNSYWCTYDSSLVNVDCHLIGASCAPIDASCLKRATGTGGCDSVGNVIGCRALQAQFAAGTIEARDFRTTRCEPCVPLPFQPIPDVCPGELSEPPRYASKRPGDLVNAMEALIRERRDLYIGRPECFPVVYSAMEPLSDHSGCARRSSPCTSPASGRLEWHSNHVSQLAVVNTPVTVVIRDIAPVFVDANYLTRGLLGKTRTFVMFPEGIQGQNNGLLRIRQEPAVDRAYADVVEIGSATVECVAQYLPRFVVEVQELWPDNPADEVLIPRLFGSNALDWWPDATEIAERRKWTESRGLTFWDDLTTPEQQRARVDSLRVTVRCDNRQDDEIWCRWTPLRSGYYRLSAAGAWALHFYGDRLWIAPTTNPIVNLNTRLVNLTDSDRADLASTILSWGHAPRDFGFNDSLDGLLSHPLDSNGNPTGQDRAELYESNGMQSGANGLSTRCPPLDLRVGCTGPSLTGNYAETEPLGVLVYEARVVTRAPSGP